MLEREYFKLAVACFLKLSFFCVFVGDFCSPPCSSGLAPNKGHEKRGHMGMASLPHGRAGHGAISSWRHNRLPACGTGPVAQGGWAGWGLAGSCRRQGDIRSKAGKRKLQREISLECIMDLSGCPHSSAIALRSSPTTVGGVCTYVQVSVACSEPSMAAALPQLS